MVAGPSAMSVRGELNRVWPADQIRGEDCLAERGEAVVQVDCVVERVDRYQRQQSAVFERFVAQLAAIARLVRRRDAHGRAVVGRLGAKCVAWP